MPSFANIQSVQCVHQSTHSYCMLPVVHEEVLLTWYAAFKQFWSEVMLMTPLEYGMQMKLGAFSVPNLAKLSHWLEHLPGYHRYKGTDYYLVCSFCCRGSYSNNPHIFRPEISV